MFAAFIEIAQIPFRKGANQEGKKAGKRESRLPAFLIHSSHRIAGNYFWQSLYKFVKLFPTQTDEGSLLQFGREVVSLLEKRDFHSLADRFGYVFAYGRAPAAAIEEELGSCIARYHASVEEKPSVSSSMAVKYFKENDSSLWVVVECVFITSEGCPILAELIGTTSGEDRYILLEEVSLIGA